MLSFYLRPDEAAHVNPYKFIRGIHIRDFSYFIFYGGIYHEKQKHWHKNS